MSQISTRILFFYFCLCLIASCQTSSSRDNLLVISETNGFPKTDTMVVSSGSNVFIDVSNYPDADIIDLEFSDGFYWIWIEDEEVIELSKETLISDPKSPKFESFESGRVFRMIVGKSKDGTPYKTASLYGTMIKVE